MCSVLVRFYFGEILNELAGITQYSVVVLYGKAQVHQKLLVVLGLVHSKVLGKAVILAPIVRC
jgi:hypothetical protein